MSPFPPQSHILEVGLLRPLCVCVHSCLVASCMFVEQGKATELPGDRKLSTNPDGLGERNCVSVLAWPWRPLHVCMCLFSWFGFDVNNVISQILSHSILTATVGANLSASPTTVHHRC